MYRASVHLCFRSINSHCIHTLCVSFTNMDAALPLSRDHYKQDRRRKIIIIIIVIIIIIIIIIITIISYMAVQA